MKTSQFKNVNQTHNYNNIKEHEFKKESSKELKKHLLMTPRYPHEYTTLRLNKTPPYLDILQNW